MNFFGDATPLTQQDFEEAAQELGCTVAAVKAVAKVESGGAGFLPDGRPKILFERHVFYKENGKRFNDTHPHISWPKWTRSYLGGALEYGRLEEAMTLDHDAALRSASWGKFQVMGYHHAAIGWPDIADFIAAMVSGEAGQLKAFVGYIKANRLDDELRRLDWAGFARGYNGEGYRENRYDEKMAAAYEEFLQGGARTDNPYPLLKMGSRGQSVMHLQELLGITQDGDFGPGTKRAVIAFQEGAGLHADGIVGQMTWNLLILGTAEEPEEPEVEENPTPPRPDPDATRPPLRQGDRGEDVELLQELLGLTADGIFGPGTKRAVVAFQEENGLEADGIVGRNTWKALFAG